jgi:nucleotide-binding universal stress UspA family protein
MITVAAEKRTAIANILYATDFSPAAITALPYVREIAMRYGSKVHVLHVRPPVSYAFVTPNMVPNVLEIEERLEIEQTKELDKFFARIPHEIVFESGELSDEVDKLIHSKLIDLVVIGTNGRTGAAKVLLGSVAAEILRQAPCPVLTVGPHCAGRTKTDLEMREILYATDFSPESIAAAPYAISLAQEIQAEITLVNVIPRSNGPELVHPEEYIDSSWRRLRNMVPPEAELWCTPTCIVTTGQPAEAILKLAWDRRPDLIVVGAKDVEHSMTVATHLSRATAQTVIANAPCPVLTVRVPAHSGETGLQQRKAWQSVGVVG